MFIEKGGHAGKFVVPAYRDDTTASILERCSTEDGFHFVFVDRETVGIDVGHLVSLGVVVLMLIHPGEDLKNIPAEVYLILRVEQSELEDVELFLLNEADEIHIVMSPDTCSDDLLTTLISLSSEIRRGAVIYLMTEDGDHNEAAQCAADAPASLDVRVQM